MVPDFVISLQAEAVRLERQLQCSPIYRQLEVVRESLRQLQLAYEIMSDALPDHADAIVADTPIPTPVPAVPDEGLPPVRRARRGSTSGTVADIALGLFRQTGRRATSGQILALLRERGIEIDNAKPQAQIASILSHNPLFDNAGDSHGSGYGLREWTTEEESRRSAQATVTPNFGIEQAIKLVTGKSAVSSEETAD